MTCLENLNEMTCWEADVNGGGVAGGDSGEVGLPCLGGGGEGEREHSLETVAGLDGGFTGSGREAASPADRDLVPAEPLSRSACVFMAS